MFLPQKYIFKKMESYSKKVAMAFMFQKSQFTDGSYDTHYFGHGVLIHKTRA